MRTAGSKNAATPERRRAILDAALAEFVERGLDAATLNGICARLGATKGSLYHHFRSKEKIAVTLYAEAIAAIHAGVLAELVTSRPIRVSIESAIFAYLSWFGSHRPLGRFVFAVMNCPSLDAKVGEVQKTQRRFIEGLAAWLEPYRARGEIVGLPAHVQMSLLIGPSRDFLRHWLPTGCRRELQDAKECLPPAAWRTIAAR